MSEILRARLKDSIGKYAKIFLHNGFKFEGTITNCDDEELELREAEGFKILKIISISEAKIEENNERGRQQSLF
ncbi:MAG TPA: hypothetical protein VMZ91_12100 [Candidatus Paceibacterota bacterium]|nr:hypothetical protein [Candidatus Paceibacterota bacterium]